MALIDELTGRAPKVITREPVTARVVRSDETGVWVVPLGGDMRYPIGPVRGPGVLGLGDIVLLVFTQERPWVLGTEVTTPHELDTTDVHGIPDTAQLETQTGAQEKADEAAAGVVAAATDAAVDAAEATATTVVGTHNADTTDVHGIGDTAELETQAGAQAKADAAEAASVPRAWDTGNRRLIDAGDVTNMAGLQLWVRRTWSTVTVTIAESPAGTASGVVALDTLPVGFRPSKASALTPVWNATAGAVSGHLRVGTDGACVLTAATSGGLHTATATFMTTDAWPDPLPGTAD